MDIQRRDVQVLEATTEEINAALYLLCQWLHEIRETLAMLHAERERSPR